MAKPSLKNLKEKPLKNSKKESSVKIDTSLDAIQERAESKKHLPTNVLYKNDYSVKGKNRLTTQTIDLTDLVAQYPHNKTLIEHLIVGLNMVVMVNQSFRTIYSYGVAIRCFIEFLNSEGNLSNSYVVNIADIDLTVTKSFSNYLISEYPKSTQRNNWYNSIKRIVKRLREVYPDNPLVTNPSTFAPAPKQINNHKQGYLPKEMIELIEACKSDITEIKRYHKMYKALDQEIRLEEWTLENVMYWIQERMKNDKHYSGKSRSVVKTFLKHVKRPIGLQEFMENSGYTIDDVCNSYINKGSELALNGRNPLEMSVSENPDIETARLQFNLALGTLKKRYPDFPFYYPLDKALNFLRKSNHTVLLVRKVCAIVSHSSSKIEFMNGRLRGQAAFAAMHFVADTIYPFLLLVLINTGWNLESVLSIPDDVDRYTTPDLLDPNSYVIVMGLKKRGQKEDPKVVVRRSLINNQWDTYSLLKYIESIIIQYKDSPHYNPGMLWQFTQGKHHGNSDKLITTINNSDNLFKMSERFVERHEFKFISDKTIDHPKIRSGFSALKQLMGSTEAMLSRDLDHDEIETTAIHYSSDQSSNMIFDMRIKQMQNQFVDSLINYEARIVESQSLQNLRDAINDAHTQEDKEKAIKEQAKKTGLDEKTIIHLVDVGSEKYILACVNSNQPDWPGADQYVKPGQHCRYFNKCGLCKQAVVFPESLPYIARRILDLQKLQQRIPSVDWFLKFDEEYKSWNEILKVWNNQEQVKDAWTQARIGKVVLPQIMRGR